MLRTCTRSLRLTAANSARLRSVVPSNHKRFFSSSSPSTSALASHHTAHPTVVVFTPSPQHIEQEELDVDLIPPQDIKIELTDRAAEQLRLISAKENNPNAALRVAVESGGCHGYQYKMELATHRQPDDYHFSHPTVTPSNILVDAVSLSLLNGSTIDFVTELIGSSFRVLENPQAKGSGCGCGISWELKL
ncbi:hypothetical protein PILCRDRAFT_825276 [Piloderma croceum F 1598]|uniref:Core domain-containing protein n=1 Tax=Piloderma croceum (strain F 1598) TaxID=765440 RepID=A0A0C3BJF4_PILCF|nr:hypothetical protein PILCRDRAFT_825276 [Piloderma croceum F 1598]